jgi:pimeloyl-ACP methyl ester carboxylesterase
MLSGRASLNTPEPPIQNIDIGGQRIAYRLRDGSSPTLVFLPGYASDMEGAKAVAIDVFAGERGLAMLRLDYSGTGSSGGRFEEGTLALWLGQAVALVDQLTSGPLIVIGSSMGAWIALHLALLRSERVQALVGIAAATDFTQWGFTDAEAAQRQGVARGFWQSGQELLLLLGGEIAIDCPVRLVHGEADRDVPLEVAFRTLRALRSADVQLLTIKGGGHRLSEPHEIDAILHTLAGLLEP